MSLKSCRRLGTSRLLLALILSHCPFPLDRLVPLCLCEGYGQAEAVALRSLPLTVLFQSLPLQST